MMEKYFSENKSQQINLFFSTPILFIKNFEYSQKLLPIAKKYLSDDRFIGNTLSYRSTYTHTHTNLEQQDEMQDFVNYVCGIGKNFLSSLGYDFNRKTSAMVMSSDMRKNDHHMSHVHPNCILSGVFYLQVPSNSAKINFHDPRDFRKFRNLNPQKGLEYNHLISPSIQITPEAGLLLMWESWLEHEVEKNNSDDGRITLVFNIE